MESNEIKPQPEHQQTPTISNLNSNGIKAFHQISDGDVSDYEGSLFSDPPHNQIGYSSKPKVLQKDALHAGNIAIEIAKNAAENYLRTEDIKVVPTNNGRKRSISSLRIKARDEVQEVTPLAGRNKTINGTGKSPLRRKYVNQDTNSSDSLDESDASDQSEELDSESESTNNPLEKLREENRKRMEGLINSLRDPELEAMMFKNNRGNAVKQKENFRKRKSENDSTIRFNVPIPLEVRKSSRLQNKPPQYSEFDLDGFEESTLSASFKKRRFSEEFLAEDLEEIVARPKSKRRKTGYNEAPHLIIPVEDVTDSMLKNIAERVKTKVYSDNGTTCHQCRQKTLDQKTCCRSPDCVGSRGMFCGVCIRNRYGEDCAEALLNPNWICPVCRGKCNCSICRNRQGKRPTGVLAPLAWQQGYKCVDHFLAKLRGEGDIPKEDHQWAIARDPEALLGFSRNTQEMYLSGGKVRFQICKTCMAKANADPENLLGFSADGKTAVMGGYKSARMLV